MLGQNLEKKTEENNSSHVTYENTIKIRVTTVPEKANLIINKYSQKKYFIGSFKEHNCKVHRKFIDNIADGRKIYYSVFRANKPVANLVVVHGWLNSTKLFELAEYMAQRHINVHLFDLPGFGYSEGFMYSVPIEEYLSSIQTVLLKVDDRLPTFLYGHFIGALAILLFIYINRSLQLDGVILTSPLITVPEDRKVSFIKSIFVNNFTGYMFSPLLVNSFMNPTALTKDNYYIKSLCSDKFGVFSFGSVN